MVLFKIDSIRIAILKLEGYAPRAIYVDCVARRIKSLQRVEIEPGQVQVSQRFRYVETIHFPL